MGKLQQPVSASIICNTWPSKNRLLFKKAFAFQKSVALFCSALKTPLLIITAPINPKPRDSARHSPFGLAY